MKRRAQGLYEEDRSKTLRKSHENPMMKKLYDEFLGEPYEKMPMSLSYKIRSKKENVTIKE